MSAIRRVVVVVLLAVWSFPAMGAARSAPADPAQLSAPRASTAPTTARASCETETESLATREQSASGLQDFKGGQVYVYLGSGALLVIVIILLILLV